MRISDWSSDVCSSDLTEKIIVIDEGTTSTRTMLFAADGTPLGSAQREFRQHYPAPGLVEHDAADIWTATLACTRALLDHAGGAARVAATENGRAAGGGRGGRCEEITGGPIAI